MIIYKCDCCGKTETKVNAWNWISIEVGPLVHVATLKLLFCIDCWVEKSLDCVALCSKYEVVQ